MSKSIKTIVYSNLYIKSETLTNSDFISDIEYYIVKKENNEIEFGKYVLQASEFNASGKFIKKLCNVEINCKPNITINNITYNISK